MIFLAHFGKKKVSTDRIFDHLLKVMSEDDYLVIAFHRGHLNPSRDSHFSSNHLKERSVKGDLFKNNLMNYIKRFESKKVKIYLVKDGPLLNDSDTALEACMYKFLKSKERSCLISFSKDNETRYVQSESFDYVSSRYDFVKSIDYLPQLYDDGLFSPIDLNAEYLMFDRHHLTQNASLSLIPFFMEELK